MPIGTRSSERPRQSSQRTSYRPSLRVTSSGRRTNLGLPPPAMWRNLSLSVGFAQLDVLLGDIPSTLQKRWATREVSPIARLHGWPVLMAAESPDPVHHWPGLFRARSALPPSETRSSIPSEIHSEVHPCACRLSAGASVLTALSKRRGASRSSSGADTRFLQEPFNA